MLSKGCLRRHDGKMASVSDPCDAVNGNPTASQDKTGQMPAIYQGLAICLKDPDKKYEDKVCAVLATWERLASSSQSDNIQCLIECLFSDTLRLILRGEWPKLQPAVKTHLSVVLKQTSATLGNADALALCRIVSRLVQDPWGDSTLLKIFTGNGTIDDEEAEKFCVRETASLLVMRLEMLCDSKCEDLALRLLQVCQRSLKQENGQFTKSCSKQSKEFFTDLNIALLYRSKHRTEVISHLQQLVAEDELRLVERFLTKRAAEQSCRIWRSSLKIAQFVSGYCLARALVKLPPPSTLAALTSQWLKAQKQLGVSNQDLVDMLKKLVAHAETSAHMYIVCSILREEESLDLKPLCIELYVRAAVVDVNDLERRKLQGDAEGVRQTELTLAETFSALGDLVSSNVNICRECVLTSFSLQPTRQRFEKLQNLAKIGQERKTLKSEETVSVEHSPSPSIEPPPAGSGGGPGDCPAGLDFDLKQVKRKESFEDADSGVDINDVANGIGDLEENFSSSPSPYTSEAATSLGVSKQIMNDLAVVLHSPRWEVLSWGGGWSELRPLCERYLENPERMRSVTKELKYLNIDYSQFKNMPKVERGQYDGIEKGYETFVQHWSSEEETETAFTSCQENEVKCSSASSKLVERRARQLKKKLLGNLDTGKVSPDSDCSASSRVRVRRKPGRPRKDLERFLDPLIERKDPIEQLKALRMFRPNRVASRGDDPGLLASSFPVRLSQSNNMQSPSMCNVTDADHFAPLLSTLNMNPKIVLTRTPVNSPTASPIKASPHSKGALKSNEANKCVWPTKGSYVLLKKLDFIKNPDIQRTLTNLKGLDMVQVRHTHTAVHMVELPDPPATHIMANGLPNNGSNSSDGSQSQQQLQERQADKPTNSAADDSRSSFVSPGSTPAPKTEEDPEETVTLVSTPSVTIFEVAHRPHTTNTVLQPVSAITGVSSSVTRARMAPASTTAPNTVHAVGPRASRPVVEGSENSNSSQLGSSSLAQMLAQPPAVLPAADQASFGSYTNSQAQNGSQPTGAFQTRPQVQHQQPPANFRSLEPGRNIRPSRREHQQQLHLMQQQAGQQQEVANSTTGDVACRVPLVKYVDLDMVSSPSRIRQNNMIGHRRSSQGSNSSSPDPHHGRNAAKARSGSSSQNPTSPSLSSPMSPALQPPLSPMATRKPYAYRQDGKSYLSSSDGPLKLGGDLKQPSPSHPSQSSSPFSRPSSRSQDASSSPSDLLGSMYPSNMVYPGAEAVPASGGRAGFGAGISNSLPALPKFQQAFGRKTNFSVLPSLSETLCSTSNLPGVSHIADPLQQQQHQQQHRTFGDRRFAEQQNPPAEEEGLGSKLHSILESALNGHIGRSPSRHPSGQSQLLQSGDLLLPGSISDSPFVQAGSDNSVLLSNLEPSSSTLEQLREFESIFERVASTSQLKEQHPWSDLGQNDDSSFLPSAVEYLVPSAGYPASLDAVTSSVEDTLRSDSALEAEAPLIHLLNVASAARQALEEEENKSNSSTQQEDIALEQAETKAEQAELSPEETQQPVAVASSAATETTAVAIVIQSVVTSPAGSSFSVTQESAKLVVTTSTPTTITTTKTETTATTKTSRSKQGVKSSPAVSPGSSGANASKGGAAGAAAPKTPQKAHDDEMTVLRVNAILEEYREQLRNSPDLQNKPAPRRRSNPLPSPTATPKRRKSSQNKVKLLSQHARPVDSASSGSENNSGAPAVDASPSSEVAAGASNSLPDTHLSDIKTEASSTAVSAPVINSPATETVTILGSVTTAPRAPAQTSEAAVSLSHGNVTATVTNATIPLASGGNMPIAVQQVLVTSQAGVRQVLLPVSIAGPFRQALVRGTSQRFVTVRPVTVSGASGFISLPTRLPLTVRTIPTTLSTEAALSSAVAAAALVGTSNAVTIASSSPSVTVTKATDTRVSIQELLTSQVTDLLQQQQQTPQPNVQRPIISTASTVHWAPAVSQLEVTGQKLNSSKTESGVLRFVPTVNRVSIPLPQTFESTTLLAAENCNSQPLNATPAQDPGQQEWSSADEPGATNAEDDPAAAATDSVIVPDDKMLIDDGVSEFLPCADFTGPGVSPTPCFPFTDSPLDSQNSSRAPSPAAFQGPAADEDTGSFPATESPTASLAAPQSNHGVTESSSNTGVDRHTGQHSPKKNPDSQTEESVSQTAETAAGCDAEDRLLPPQDEEAAAPVLSKLEGAEAQPESGAVETSFAFSASNSGDSLEGGGESAVKMEESPSPGSGLKEEERKMESPLKDEPDLNAQNEGAALHSAASPNSGPTVRGRRLSNRGHVKKNCPCCVGVPDNRKRSRSESCAGENSPGSTDCSSASAKRPSSAKTEPKTPKVRKGSQPRKR